MKKKDRLLRTYQRIAHVCHSCCSLCGEEIYPGEEYIGEVWIKNGKIVEYKQHLWCPLDPDPEAEKALSRKNPLKSVKGGKFLPRKVA